MLTSLPVSVQHFIELRLSTGLRCLPDQYPTVDSFYGFQRGYRYDTRTLDSLLGADSGRWQENWYAIASNSSHDPFVVDFSESAWGFPVYHCQRVGGAWKRIKVADSLADMSELLENLCELRGYPRQAYDFLQEVTLDNELWTAVCTELREQVLDGPIDRHHSEALRTMTPEDLPAGTEPRPNASMVPSQHANRPSGTTKPDTHTTRLGLLMSEVGVSRIKVATDLKDQVGMSMTDAITDHEE